MEAINNLWQAGSRRCRFSNHNSQTPTNTVNRVEQLMHSRWYLFRPRLVTVDKLCRHGNQDGCINHKEKGDDLEGQVATYKGGGKQVITGVT